MCMLLSFYYNENGVILFIYITNIPGILIFIINFNTEEHILNYMGGTGVQELHQNTIQRLPSRKNTPQTHTNVLHYDANQESTPWLLVTYLLPYRTTLAFFFFFLFPQQHKTAIGIQNLAPKCYINSTCIIRLPQET